jgi:hypothetical protein
MIPDSPVLDEASPAPRRRLRFTHVFTFFVALIVGGHTYLAVGEYQDQLRTVEAMEQSQRPYTGDMSDRFDTDPRVVSFQADPVFSSASWRSLLTENHKALSGSDHADPRAYGIWWPGLTQRAEAALPAVWDRTEFAMATGTVAVLCNGKALTADDRITEWHSHYGHSDDPYLKDDPYWQAKRAVMPDVIRAGSSYFCGPAQPKA